MIHANSWAAMAVGWLGTCAAALVLSAGLGGCAGQSVATPSPTASYTASDEPETRKRATNRLKLAILYFQDGKANFALDEVKQSILADPSWFEPYWMRGLIQMQLGDNAQAEISFQKALSMNPNAPDLKHNYGILLCKTGRVQDGLALFDEALASPGYGQRAKTFLEQGNCLLSVGRKAQAETSFLKSFELDAGNPVTGFKLASLLFARQDDVHAQFYIRRINNSDQSSADSLWLGVKIERRIGNADAVAQLGGQLRKRFAASPQALAFERGAFDE